MEEGRLESKTMVAWINSLLADIYNVERDIRQLLQIIWKVRIEFDVREEHTKIWYSKLIKFPFSDLRPCALLLIFYMYYSF